MKKTTYVLIVGIMLTLMIGLVSWVNANRNQLSNDVDLFQNAIPGEWDEIIKQITDPAQKATEIIRLEQFRQAATRNAAQALAEANFTGTRSIATIPTPVEVGSPLRGVIEDLGFDDLRRELKSTNGWIGEIGGLVYSLSAGFYRDDESLGLVQLRIITTEEYSRTTVNVDCPRKSGALRVEDVKGSRVILRASNGELFYFDLLARQFVESLDVVVPTATPFPPPRAEDPDPTPTWNPYP